MTHFASRRSLLRLTAAAAALGASSAGAPPATSRWRHDRQPFAAQSPVTVTISSIVPGAAWSAYQARKRKKRRIRR